MSCVSAQCDSLHPDSAVHKRGFSRKKQDLLLSQKDFFFIFVITTFVTILLLTYSK